LTATAAIESTFTNDLYFTGSCLTQLPTII
jgi:hypothetical protein